MSKKIIVRVSGQKGKSRFLVAELVGTESDVTLYRMVGSSFGELKEAIAALREEAPKVEDLKGALAAALK